MNLSVSDYSLEKASRCHATAATTIITVMIPSATMPLVDPISETPFACAVVVVCAPNSAARVADDTVPFADNSPSAITIAAPIPAAAPPRVRKIRLMSGRRQYITQKNRTKLIQNMYLPCLLLYNPAVLGGACRRIILMRRPLHLSGPEASAAVGSESALRARSRGSAVSSSGLRPMPCSSDGCRYCSRSGSLRGRMHAEAHH